MREIRRSRCTCGRQLWDKRTEYEIEPGAFIVCIYCGQTLMLDAELIGRPVALGDVPEEYRADLRDAQRLVRMCLAHGLQFEDVIKRVATRPKA